MPDRTDLPVLIPALLAIATLIVTGVVVVRAVMDRRVRARTEEARVTERLYHEAEAARRDAERANRAKSDFLAVMSHEIRTPINAMIGYAELLEIGISGPLNDAQRAQLARIRTSARYLLRQINEVLDLSKVESGRLDVAREPALAADTVDAALAIVRPLATAKGVRLAEGCEGHPEATFVGDEQRVQQIVVNLATNAVKFTDPGGAVTIRCDVHDVAPPPLGARERTQWVAVHVEDTGIGIAPENLERVFEPFVQIETGLTRTRGGTGLGLAISRELARLMGGEITVESTPGRGSCFTLWLEASERTAAAREEGRSARQIAREAFGPDASATALAAAGLVRPGALAAGGGRIIERLESLLEALVARLRREPDIHVAREVGELLLRDHWGAFLVDVAESMMVLDGAAEPGQLVLDGTAIQRTIAERHGAQRQRLGWSEDELRREMLILRSLVEDEIATELAAFESKDREIALAALASFFEHGLRASLVGHRQAAQEAA